MVAKSRTTQDRIFDLVNYIILGAILLSVLYPLYFIIIASFSDPDYINSGKVWLFPKGITLEGYGRIFRDDSLIRGYRNSLVYTSLGTTINIILTLTGAYVLSRRDLYGRKLFTIFILITMFFQGGIVPRYLLIKSLGMTNTIWAMVLPQAIMVWNLIVTRSFFETSIPDELLKASYIDGCTNTRFFVSIALPLSKAIVAVMVVFYGVWHWNSFFDPLIFLQDEKKYPLQLVLRSILIEAEVQSTMLDDTETAAVMERIADMIKYGAIILASLPVLFVYPFAQRHFVQGIMVGSVKG